MEKQMSFAVGTVIGLLALAGYIKKDKHVLGLMNVDTAHSVLRTPLAALLLLGAKSDLKTTRSILFGTGIFYLLMGALGAKDRQAGGLLPSGLTGFDLAYHVVVGAGLLWIGSRAGRMMKSS